ncbi:Uncharacterised protein [Escherichia coli]|uniref:Uncharacterized protein n=1 Tax=Escherichia coli TaxID=562 RepID=A0A376VWY0_ECOLX|nr:Uncharacterised protein [Escherichia coli]
MAIGARFNDPGVTVADEYTDTRKREDNQRQHRFITEQTAQLFDTQIKNIT